MFLERLEDAARVSSKFNRVSGDVNGSFRNSGGREVARVRAGQNMMFARPQGSAAPVEIFWKSHKFCILFLARKKLRSGTDGSLG